jgi:hypothetical protein
MGIFCNFFFIINKFNAYNFYYIFFLYIFSHIFIPPFFPKHTGGQKGQRGQRPCLCGVERGTGAKKRGTKGTKPLVEPLSLLVASKKKAVKMTAQN